MSYILGLGSLSLILWYRILIDSWNSISSTVLLRSLVLRSFPQFVVWIIASQALQHKNCLSHQAKGCCCPLFPSLCLWFQPMQPVTCPYIISVWYFFQLVQSFLLPSLNGDNIFNLSALRRSKHLSSCSLQLAHGIVLEDNAVRAVPHILFPPVF